MVQMDVAAEKESRSFFFKSAISPLLAACACSAKPSRVLRAAKSSANTSLRTMLSAVPVVGDAPFDQLLRPRGDVGDHHQRIGDVAADHGAFMFGEGIGAQDQRTLINPPRRVPELSNRRCARRPTAITRRNLPAPWRTPGHSAEKIAFGM